LTISFVTATGYVLIQASAISALLLGNKRRWSK
jgi:hypothetical protein